MMAMAKSSQKRKIQPQPLGGGAVVQALFGGDEPLNMMDRMYGSMEEFGQALSNLGERVGNNAQQVFKKAVFMFLQQVAMRTPVDTGRARAGWQLTADNTSDYVPPPGDYSDYDISAIPNVPNAVSFYCISNNVEYILALEDGHSKQAPAGMIALTMAEFADYFNAAAKSMGFEVTG